jgi:hypothetical protein
VRVRGSPTGPVNRKTRNDQNRTRTRATHEAALRMDRSFGLTESGSSRHRKQRARPSARSSERPYFRCRLRVEGDLQSSQVPNAAPPLWLGRPGATSRGCSRIGNRHGKLFTPFSPVPPPLPGCAGFPTSHPPQVTDGRLGSEEVAVRRGKPKNENKKRGTRR